MSRTYFADTFYWIALIFPRDAFHVSASSFSRTVQPVHLVTTDEVLTEVLSHFAGLGQYWRAKVAAPVQDVRSDPDVDVLPQTRADFDAALALYEARPDKAIQPDRLPVDGRVASTGRFRSIDQRSSLRPRRVHDLISLVGGHRPMSPTGAIVDMV